MYLEQKGNKYWAACPFHNDKTPSFVINHDEQFYYCFSCHRHGSVITFFMEKENMTFPEAVEHLAKMVGMELPEEENEEDRQRRINREKALLACKLAARHYFDNLYKPEAQIALEYLAKRQISEKTIKEFGMGYSVDFYSLTNALRAKGVSNETMNLAGLTTEKNADALAKRLIIPIINAKGQVIGFGGRSLEKEIKFNKYKNTSGTILFDKRRTLFGINLIKKNQIEEKFNDIILTEGYMDVISIYQAGIHNVVASMGTSLTNEQCVELKRYVNEIFVCYDGDAAGQNATWRSLDMLANVGLDVKVMSMPDGMDPDDVIKKYGKEYYLGLKDSALPLIEFKIRNIANKHDLNTIVGKEKFAKETVPVLQSLDPIQKKLYIKMVSELSGLDDESINNSLSSEKAKPKKQETVVLTDKEDAISADNKARILAARFVISSILNMKDYVDMREIKKEFFIFKAHSIIYDYIQECIENKKRPIIGDIIDRVPEFPAEVDKIIGEMQNIPISKHESYYHDCIKKLSETDHKKRLADLMEKLKTATGAERNALAKELISLTKKKGTEGD